MLSRNGKGEYIGRERAQGIVNEVAVGRDGNADGVQEPVPGGVDGQIRESTPALPSAIAPGRPV